jgi:hypothetical protein
MKLNLSHPSLFFGRRDQAEAFLDEWLADPRNERMARLFGTK